MIHITIFHENEKDEKEAIDIAEALRKQHPYTVMVRRGNGYGGTEYEAPKPSDSVQSFTSTESITVSVR